MESESSEHVFWGCEKALEIWTLSIIPLEAHKVTFPKFEDLIWHLKFEQRIRNDLVKLFIMVSWAIWFNRNEVRQGKARLYITLAKACVSADMAGSKPYT